MISGPETPPRATPSPAGFVAIILAIYAAWARGGTPTVLQAPLPVLGAVLLLTLWLLPGRGEPRPRVKRILRDPVAWAGMLFLVLLAVQWWNAGRFHYFDPYTSAWGYTTPRIPWLTSAITRAEAMEMLRWFFPAWALLIYLRHGIQTPRTAQWLLAALVVNGCLLAGFGMIQQWSGTRSIFWITDLGRTRFFASFGYENHAGSYFVLMSALAMGLLLNEVLRPDRRPRPLVVAGWGLATVLNFVGANLSYSRAGILLAWTLAVVAVVYLLWQGYYRWRPSTWINVGLAALVLAATAAVTAEQLGGETISRELASLRRTYDRDAVRRPQDTLVLGDRVAMFHAALGIWQDYPWFGCGGWGYRYLMPYQLPADNWKWSSTALGKANAHNDPAQFLAEFGGVGAGLMLICALGLSFTALRSRPKRPITFLALSGAGLVLIHSLVDLPFRSPGILYAWLLVLGCAALLERKK